MQIHTTARHCELAADDRAFAQQRLEKLEKFARDLHEAHLIVTAEGYRHTAEITVHLKGREVVSREASTDARAAIDLAADHLEVQLRKLKGRRVDRYHGRLANGKPGEDGNGAASAAPADEDAYENGEE
jgi:putative sigma-54 modulation protein